MIEHKIKHYSQPTNYSCSQTSLAMLLSFFGQDASPEDLIEQLPVRLDDRTGRQWGSIPQDIARLCIDRGFDVTIYTADYEIIDQSWLNLAQSDILNRLRAVKDLRNVASLGKDSSMVYAQSYIDFLNKDGKLNIVPYMSTHLLDNLLANSPLFFNVNMAILNKAGRRTMTGLRSDEPNDVDGILQNHSVILFGKSNNENYLLADPWRESENGFREIEPEHLLAAMAGAQMECNNLLFQIEPKRETTK
ncbi:C39 family peptidase [Candidatus Saccharibacteria bacterium]|jgi:hypothetical protein|nr:C39 family peptidase [Candidatus Saccharibacteria bacterium]